MTWKIGGFLLDDRVKLFYTVSAYQLNSKGIIVLNKIDCLNQILQDFFFWSRY
jgi:hypothetical protein